MKQNTREEISAGGVVFRRISGSADQRISFEFLIGKHSGYHKWVLPKGLVEQGETPELAAVREVEEEVGVKAKIIGREPIKRIEYWYYADLDLSGDTTRRVKKYAEGGGGKTRVHKQVLFYLMEMEEDLGKEGWEMEERKWVGYEEVKELLAFETEREVFDEAWKVITCL